MLEKERFGSGRTKRSRSANLWTVTENKEMMLWLEKMFRTEVFKKTKFLANEQELGEAMYTALMLTEPVAADLKTLESEEQDTMIRRYLKV